MNHRGFPIEERFSEHPNIPFQGTNHWCKAPLWRFFSLWKHCGGHNMVALKLLLVGEFDNPHNSFCEEMRYVRRIHSFIQASVAITIDNFGGSHYSSACSSSTPFKMCIFFGDGLCSTATTTSACVWVRRELRISRGRNSPYILGFTTPSNVPWGFRCLRKGSPINVLVNVSALFCSARV